MATLIAGGKEYHVPELNFIALELAWPYIQQATMAPDPIRGVSAALMVIAAGITQSPDFRPEAFDIPAGRDLDRIHQQTGDYLKRVLKATEVGEVKTTMMKVIEEAGLEVTEGEMLAVLQEMMDQTGSTETAPNTSPNSSPPDAKEEAGTE